MSEITPIIITACGASAITVVGNLISQLLQRRADRKSKKDDKIAALCEAQQLVMLDRIKYLGQRYINDGAVDFDDRRLLNKMHKVYHDKLGGNGDLDNIMKAVNKLQLKG